VAALNVTASYCQRPRNSKVLLPAFDLMKEVRPKIFTSKATSTPNDIENRAAVKWIKL